MYKTGIRLTDDQVRLDLQDALDGRDYGWIVAALSGIAERRGDHLESDILHGTAHKLWTLDEED